MSLLSRRRGGTRRNIMYLSAPLWSVSSVTLIRFMSLKGEDEERAQVYDYND